MITVGRIASFFPLLCLLGSTTAQLEKPILLLKNQRHQKIEIYTRVNEVLEYVFHEVHGPRDNKTNTVKVEFNAFWIEDLKRNTVYKLRGRYVDGGSYSPYSDWLAVRTAPGPATFSYLARPTFVILMLEQVPGATEWKVKYSALEKDLSYVSAPNHEITSNYYVVVIRNLRADHVHSCSVRISKVVFGQYLEKDKSPFGNPANFKTAPLSLFGRVILPLNPFNTSLVTSAWLDDMKTKLLSHYSEQHEVKVLEVENSTSGDALLHYEVLIKEKAEANVTLSKYVLPESSEFKDSKIHLHASGTGGYDYEPLGDNTILYPTFSTNPKCSSSEKRTWTTMSHEEAATKLVIPNIEGNATTSFQFIDRELLANGERKHIFLENSVNIIGHNYLVKVCPSNSTDQTVYDRIFTARYANITDQYTIVYTTAPGAIPSDDSMVGIRPIVTNASGHRVEFTIPKVTRAVRYDFKVTTDQGDIVENITLSEMDIDSSSNYKVATNNLLTNTNSYVLIMQVITRLANGTEVESPKSNVSFYAGLPKPTIRVTGVHTNNFTVSWPVAKRATSYTIQLRDKNFNKRTINVNAPATQYTVASGINAGDVFLVSVASVNEFGPSEFSDEVSTEIWSFSEVKGTSFVVSWFNQSFRDPNFRIAINSSSVGGIMTRNHTARLSNLISGTQYRITVTYNSSETDWSVLFDTYQYTVPGVPTNLVANFSEYNFTILIKWDEVRGAQSYDVTCGSSESNQTVEVYNLTSPTYQLENVSADRTYDCGVRAVNDAGKSDPMRVWEFTGYPVPQNISIFNVTYNSVSMSWDYIRGATGYMILVRSVNVTQTFNVSSHKDNLVSGLESGTSHNFSVLAQYRNDSHWSPISSQYTAAGNPTKFSDVLVSRSSATLSWPTPRTVGRVNYTLTLSFDGATILEKETNSSTDIEVDDLTPGTEYLVEVFTTTHFLHAHQTAYKNLNNPTQLSILTAADNPTNLRYIEVKTSLITAMWTPPSFNGTIEYRALLKKGDRVLFNVTTLTSYHNFTELEAGIQYVVQVITISTPKPANPEKYQNKNGSPVITVTTVPNPPTHLSLSGYDVKSVNLTWNYSTGALSYIIAVGAHTTKKRLSEKRFHTTGLHLLISDLDTAATWFTAAVQAVNVHGLPSDPSQTIVQDAASPNPTNVSFDDMTLSSISLTWKPTAFERSVNFSVSIFNKSLLLRNIDAGPKSSHNIQGLAAGTTYRIQVATLTLLERPNKAVFINTEGAPEINVTTVPTTPTGLVASKNGSHILTSWKRSMGATSYRVGVATEHQQSLLKQSKTFTTNNVKLSFTKEASLSYSITVSATNVHGYSSPASQPVILSEQSSVVCCGPIPWWAILASSIFMFVLLIALVVYRSSRREKNKQAVGSYDVQTNNIFDVEVSVSSHSADNKPTNLPNVGESSIVNSEADSSESETEAHVSNSDSDQSITTDENEYAVVMTEKESVSMPQEPEANTDASEIAICEDEHTNSQTTTDGDESSPYANISQKSDDDKEEEAEPQTSSPEILDAAAIMQELDNILPTEDLEIEEGETEVEFQERVRLYRNRLKFSCKGKPGKLAIVDRTFFEEA